MTKMTRRGFLARTSALAATALTPIPKAMALVAPEAPPMFWFAVGHSDEYAYPFLARNLDHAISMYAHENGYRMGDCCPECEEINCTEHMTSDQWDDPVPWIEEYSEQPPGWDKVPQDREPTHIEWMRAGYSVACQGECDYGEPDDCYEFEGKALCCECLEVAKAAKLDHIIGNGYPTMFQGEKLHG